MYDVIVVGARCAGSPTAMLLARVGYRVLLLEKARFPKDKLSSHYIHQPGVALLGRWGVLDDLRSTGCTPIDREIYESPGVRLEGFSEAVDGYRTTYAPRRYILDPLLARSAMAAGVEFRDGCAVSDVVWEDGRVVGVRLMTPSGVASTERARLVVGADGMRSLIARKTGAANVVEHPRRTCTYYSYWSGVPAQMELYERPGRWVASLPTHDDLTLIMTYFPQQEYNRVRADVEASHSEAVRSTAAHLYERMALGHRVERFYGTGHQENFFRRAHGPGWVLVGDAVHHKDSITARGITDAFIQAEALVSSIGDGLHEDAALAAAMRDYEKTLDADFADLFQGVLNVAELDPRARTGMLGRLVGHQNLIDRYFSTVSGACPLDDFYNDELLAVLDTA
ncbi:FAD-dependent oxidoreductase [Pseudonocardia sp. AL041005-10]|nr:FAD-dependent oxidoreductase [Pseudonocardia sp. AL041005-10]